MTSFAMLSCLASSRAALLVYIVAVTASPGYTPVRTIVDSSGKRACAVRKCRTCEYGYKVDGWGCKICECLRGPCPERHCMACGEAGFADDNQGCQTCTCKNVCKPVNCTSGCDHGFVKDSQGCLTCQCKPHPHAKQVDSLTTGHYSDLDHAPSPWHTTPNPQQSVFVYAPPGHTPAKTRNCGIKKCGPCEYGYKADGWGCKICECLRGPCPERHCMACGDTGFAEDGQGCQTCKCKKSCKPPNCTNRCDYGYDKDLDGCLTCQCKTQRQDNKRAEYEKCLRLLNTPEYAHYADLDYAYGMIQDSPRPGARQSRTLGPK